MRSRLWVERAVPLWGKPDDGQASDQTLKTTRFAASAPLLAHDGGQPGADSARAAAALVTADQLAALGDPWFSTR